MKKQTFFTILILIFLFGIFLSFVKKEKSNEKVTEITYWQFWTGFEGKAVEDLVNKFNKSHNKVKVKMLTISEPWKKTLLSIIGGTPPDVISIVAEWIPELSTRGALLPLDDYLEQNMITKDLFIPIFWEMLSLNGHTWAIPTTPTSTALYWNKDLFKEAGLDPERPPVTLSELKEYSRKLTKKKKDGSILQAGFLPSWPTWSFGFYGVLFGGNWINKERDTITSNNAGNIEGWRWAQDFVNELGVKNIQLYEQEFGNYQGPNNPFYTGMIAIELNGVWEGNFISYFAPKIKWGAAKTYNIDGEESTIVNCDCISIPKGSKHPKEAFEFIKWLVEQENMEELCIKQKKFSPLIASDNETFIKKHPNPYIKVFIDLAKSKNAEYFPTSISYQLYKRELLRAFESVMKQNIDPEIALNAVQRKMEKEQIRQERYNKRRNNSGFSL